MNRQLKKRKAKVHQAYEERFNFQSNPKEIQIKQDVTYTHIPIDEQKLESLIMAGGGEVTYIVPC